MNTIEAQMKDVSDSIKNLDHQTESTSKQDEAQKESDMMTTVAALGIVAVGVALIEVELIIGVALGAAAMLSPQIRKLFRAEEAEATN